jgi:hypothetical protein
MMTIGLLLLCSTATAAKFGPPGKFVPAAHVGYLPSMPPQSMPAAGTTEYAEIVVTNESDGQIVVLLDASNEDLTTLSDPATATVAILHARHGRLVNARATTTFSPVRMNSGHTIHVAFTSVGKSPSSGTGDTNTFSFSSANSGRTTVRTGGHLSQNVVRVTGNPGAPPQLANVNLTLRRELAFASFGFCGILGLGLVGYRFNRKRPE